MPIYLYNDVILFNYKFADESYYKNLLFTKNKNWLKMYLKIDKFNNYRLLTQNIV